MSSHWREARNKKKKKKERKDANGILCLPQTPLPNSPVSLTVLEAGRQTAHRRCVRARLCVCACTCVSVRQMPGVHWELFPPAWFHIFPFYVAVICLQTVISQCISSSLAVWQLSIFSTSIVFFCFFPFCLFWGGGFTQKKEP
jgi:hypothetical protein